MIRNRYFFVSILLIIIALLGLLVLIKKQYLTNVIITANKDLLEVGLKFVQAFVVLIIGVFSFFKFFKGHVFRSKIQLKVECEVFEAKNEIIYFLNILIENDGPFTEYDPKVSVKTWKLGEENKEKEPKILWPDKASNDKMKVIMPNESLSFSYVWPYDKEDTVVFFEIEVLIDNGKGRISKTIAKQNKKPE